MSSETLADEKKRKDGVSTVDEPSRLRFGMRHMLHAVFYCALACWLIAVVGVAAVFFLAALVITLIMVFVLVYFRRRSGQREALLAVVSLAIDREMPLGPSFDAVSDQFTGEFRRKVRALSHYVNSGLSLPEALDREPGTLPPDAEILARIGYESGTLAGALRESTTARVGFRSAWSSLVSRMMYFLFLLCVIQGVGGFLLYFVVPKYEAILQEFRVPPLPTLRILLTIGHTLMDWAPVYIPLVFLQVMVLLTLPLTMLGWTQVELPLFHSLFKRWHSALVLRSVSWAVEGGLSMTRAFEILSDWYPSRRMRGRLARVLLDVRHGTDWLESLAHHGLVGRADVAVLSSARRVGNLPWALRETAESGERRLAYRLEAFLQVLMPFVLVAFGGLVGLIIVGYLSPLIKIIEMLL